MSDAPKRPASYHATTVAMAVGIILGVAAAGYVLVRYVTPLLVGLAGTWT